MTFGKRLRLLREERGLTQLDLAKALSLANSTISQYEADRRSPDTAIMERLASFFGVSIDYLLCRTNDRRLAGQINRERSDGASTTAEETIQPHYGGRIKELRRRAGLSANALARKVRLDPTTIYKIEGGASKPSLDALERICTALDTTLAEFFADEEDDNQVATRAAHLADGATELPPEAEKEIEQLMEYIRHKYGKKQ